MTDLQDRPMPKAYELPLPGETFNPEIFYLGALCKRGHDWEHGQTLRAKTNKNCILCGRIDALERQAKRRAADPEAYNARAAAYQRQHRATHGRESRSKHGLPYMPVGDAETQAMRKAIREAGRLPSVALLVYEQQREHWLLHPDDRAEHDRQRAIRDHRWRYMTNLGFRLYHRSKSKKRKAQERGSRTVMLSPDQLWRRWVEFDHCCAYCGCKGDMQVEHVIPISKGGEHHLGNIVPACQRCNFSKWRSDAEQWYRSQPFFSEARWLAIQSALAKGLPPAQLSLLE